MVILFAINLAPDGRGDGAVMGSLCKVPRFFFQLGRNRNRSHSNVDGVYPLQRGRERESETRWRMRVKVEGRN